MEYERDDPFERQPHFAIVRDDRRVAEFRLCDVNDDPCTYTLAAAAEVPAPAGRKMFVLAFQNIGNGASTCFCAVVWTGSQYALLINRTTKQGRLEVRRDGRIRIWDADGQGLCTWCAQRYRISEFIVEAARLRLIRSSVSPSALDPYEISASPIVIDDQHSK